MARAKLASKRGNIYFAKPKPLDFISSGCRLFDLALGGGFARRRIANVLGDKSTGKTLVAIEAMTNFARQFPDGDIKYRETEWAFDGAYAAALGLPLDRIDFGGGSHDPDTAPKLAVVEDLFDDLNDVLQKTVGEQPTLYVLDSLDALSDIEEATRAIDKATYGAKKPKILSEIFRRLTGSLAAKDVTLIFVSQIRSNLSKLTFGKQYTRSGGKAMDFYISQAVLLVQVKTLMRQVGKIKRPVGITVEARIEKNKVGLPFRRERFNIMFGYGIDDYKATCDWLNTNFGAKAFGDMKPDAALKAMRERNENVITAVNDELTQRWYSTEESFLPKQGKYT